LHISRGNERLAMSHTAQVCVLATEKGQLAGAPRKTERRRGGQKVSVTLEGWTTGGAAQSQGLRRRLVDIVVGRVVLHAPAVVSVKSDLETVSRTKAVYLPIKSPSRFCRWEPSGGSRPGEYVRTGMTDEVITNGLVEARCPFPE